MGGRPMLALAILGIPVGKVAVEDVRRILAGGADVCAAAGIPVAGGHSIDTLEPIYGLVALGTVHPDRILRNSGARAGDVLILTKGARRRHLQCRAEAGGVGRGRLPRDDRRHDADQQRGCRSAGDAGGALLHGCDGVWPVGPCAGDGAWRRAAGAAASFRGAGAGRRGGAGGGRVRHRRFGAQLAELRGRGGAAGGHAGVAARAAMRPADQRRAADRRGRGGGPMRCCGMCGGQGSRRRRPWVCWRLGRRAWRWLEAQGGTVVALAERRTGRVSSRRRRLSARDRASMARDKAAVLTIRITATSSRNSEMAASTW